MSSRLTVVIILQHTQMLNHYTVHLKLIYVNYTSKKKKNIEIIKRETTHLGQELLNKINS